MKQERDRSQKGQQSQTNQLERAFDTSLLLLKELSERTKRNEELIRKNHEETKALANKLENVDIQKLETLVDALESTYGFARVIKFILLIGGIVGVVMAALYKMHEWATKFGI